MATDQNRFNRAIELFDELNNQDPNRTVINGIEHPKELLYAQRVTTMLKKYEQNPSEELLLAARCQHIQRWKIERKNYPMTKLGYYIWRKSLRDFHAQTATKILGGVGYEDSVIKQVCTLIKKERLKTDQELQILEDVVVLVFLKYYLEEFIKKHSHFNEEKIKGIVDKSLRKMSNRGRQSAQTLLKTPLPRTDKTNKRVPFTLQKEK